LIQNQFSFGTLIADKKTHRFGVDFSIAPDAG